jgi:hypothetical protein
VDFLVSQNLLFKFSLCRYAEEERAKLAIDREKSDYREAFNGGGLYKLNPVYPELETTWFQPLSP